MATYGLTPEGFVVKPLQVIKSEEQAFFKSAFGDDLDVSDESVAGQLIGNNTKKLANLWELAQSVYNNFNPDKASNTSLDGAAALVAVTRLSATSTITPVALYGNIGTIIPIGHIIEQTVTGEQFTSQAAVTISLSSVLDITFSVDTVLNNQLYTVTLNGTGYDYTSDGTATALEIIAGLKTAIDLGSEPLIVTDNLDGTARIQADEGDLAFSISVDVNLQVDSQGAFSNYVAVNTGSLSTPINTLQIIINPIAGLNSINNLNSGTTGRNIETDEELRIRRRELLTGVGSATDEALRARLLQDVDDVISATIVSNRTDATVAGRPPHSFESIVTGGTDIDIANTIWLHQPSGIQSFGTETVVVADSEGNNQTIKFSRPTEIYIWADFVITLYSEEDFPTDGLELVKEEVVSWSLTEYVVDKDVIYQRLNIPMFEVPGISSAVITIGSKTVPTGPPPALSSANIAIAANEIAIFDVSRITTSIAP